ncbi:MAG: FlgO family outer membrane protein [Campylobacterota bacterium]|nr:FlgO family outer membrane protein [Campylobacterota bacterium]
MRQFYAILILSFLLSGCGINSYEDSFKFRYLHSTSVTNFSNLTEKLVNQLETDLYFVKPYAPLYITDFVNLKELENHSELGFMLTDELKTHVTQKFNIPIHEIEFTKYLKIGKNGTKLLSRKSNEIKNKKINSNTYGLIGTYAFTQRQLILYLKLVNLNNGVIIKSATQRTTLTDEIIHYELDESRNIPKNIYQPMVL